MGKWQQKIPGWEWRELVSVSVHLGDNTLASHCDSSCPLHLQSREWLISIRDIHPVSLSIRPNIRVFINWIISNNKGREQLDQHSHGCPAASSSQWPCLSLVKRLRLNRLVLLQRKLNFFYHSGSPFLVLGDFMWARELRALQPQAQLMAWLIEEQPIIHYLELIYALWTTHEDSCVQESWRGKCLPPKSQQVAPGAWWSNFLSN